MDHLKEFDQRVAELEARIKAWHRTSEASPLVASIGEAKNLEDRRQVAAWLGLVPRQHSSGRKPTLLGISKAGNSYSRTLLIHGARWVIFRAARKRSRR